MIQVLSDTETHQSSYFTAQSSRGFAILEIIIYNHPYIIQYKNELIQIPEEITKFLRDFNADWFLTILYKNNYHVIFQEKTLVNSYSVLPHLYPWKVIHISVYFGRNKSEKPCIYRKTSRWCNSVTWFLLMLTSTGALVTCISQNCSFWKKIEDNVHSNYSIVIVICCQFWTAFILFEVTQLCKLISTQTGLHCSSLHTGIFMARWGVVPLYFMTD